MKKEKNHKLYRKMGFYERYIKRAIDIFCSGLAIIVFCWLYAIIALLVRIKLGSPVLFTQYRPGLIDPKTGKERIFKMYKFRTMTDKKDAEGNFEVDGDIKFGDGFKEVEPLKTDMKDNLLTITGTNGFEMRLDVSEAKAGDSYDGMKIDATGIGAMRLQIGANEGQVLEVNIPAVTLQNMGIEDIDVNTQEGAKDAISRVDGAIKYVSSVRGRLGAFQNRLESSINSLDVTSENMTAAYSRIMDVDMAEEMTSYTTYQILAQAGTSMLAQANERPSQVLQLLQ